VLLAALAVSQLRTTSANRAAITLTQVGFIDFDQAAQTLSGGWRKRLVVARNWSAGPIFAARRTDQPPRFTGNRPGWSGCCERPRSVTLIATHDRAFLRAVV